MIQAGMARCQRWCSYRQRRLWKTWLLEPPKVTLLYLPGIPGYFWILVSESKPPHAHHSNLFLWLKSPLEIQNWSYISVHLLKVGSFHIAVWNGRISKRACIGHSKELSKFWNFPLGPELIPAKRLDVACCPDRFILPFAFLTSAPLPRPQEDIVW